MMSPLGRSLLASVAVSLAMPLLTGVVSAAPLLESVFPLSCEAGKSVTVTLSGKELDTAKSLIFSIPQVTATADDAGRFVVSVAGETTPQDCDVWCVADGHVSNPRRFVVSSLPTRFEVGKNDSSAAAQTIPCPGAIDGHLEAAAKFDWFQFEGKEGQGITLSCRSRSLDGSAQPVVTLFSPAGREIAHSTGRRREPLLHQKLPETGTYRVRVSDRAYRTAADSFYRLELLSGLQIIAAWPNLVQRSAAAQARLTLYGFGPDSDSESSTYLVGSRTPIETLQSGLSLSNGSLIPSWQSTIECFEAQIPVIPNTTVPSVAGSWRLHATDQAVQYEVETATESSSVSQPLSIPVLLNGRFNRQNDVDWFAFEAKKAETFLIDVYGDRLGQLMDVDMVIMDGAGKTLVTFPDKPAVKNLPPGLTQSSLDVSGSWKAPADGTFHLVLRDLYGSTLFGIDRTYALRVRKSQPSFDVVVAPPDDTTPAGYSIPKGGRTAIRVSLIRHDGLATAVRLRLSEENQKAGLVLDEAWIGPGESSGLAILSSLREADVAPQVRFLELEASTDATPPLVKRARAVTLLRAESADGRFTHRLPVSVSRAQPLVTTLSLPRSEVAPGEKLKLVLKHSLTTGTLKSDAKIEFPTLPAGMKAPAAAIRSSDTETDIEIAIPGKLLPGRYSLAAFVTATIVDGTTAAPEEMKTRVWTNAVSFRVNAPVEQPASAETNSTSKSD